MSVCLTQQLTAYQHRYYSLDARLFSVQYRDSLGKKIGTYSGSGQGFVIIDKLTDKVVAMSYANDGVTIEQQRNNQITPKAGQILWQSVSKYCVRVNFAQWQARLF